MAKNMSRAVELIEADRKIKELVLDPIRRVSLTYQV